MSVPFPSLHLKRPCVFPFAFFCASDICERRTLAQASLLEDERHQKLELDALAEASLDQMTATRHRSKSS